MQIYEVDGQITLFDLGISYGKTSPEPSPAERPRGRTSASSWRRSSESTAVPYMFLDLDGPGNLLGLLYWEILSPWRGGASTLNTGVSPNDAKGSSLSLILQDSPPKKYYLSRKACLGILRRARERGKELPSQLKWALMTQAGLVCAPTARGKLKAYHINQRNEGIDLGQISGALMATSNLQMQTFVTEGCLTPWDTRQKRIVLPGGVSHSGPPTGPSGAVPLGRGGAREQSDTLPTGGVERRGLCDDDAGADGGGGRDPGGLLLTAAFSAGAGAKAGGIGFSEQVTPTLKGSASGNCMPSVLCLNDQGGERMDLTGDQTATLRAQAGGHQPLVCLNDQGGAMMSTTEDMVGTLRAQEHGHQPLVFENHGIDARYTGPHRVAPTLSARVGTGGNNLPLIAEEEVPTVFSRQRSDALREGDVASTESARQHKEATDLVYQETVGTLTRGDYTGPNCQYVNQDKLVLGPPTGPSGAVPLGRGGAREQSDTLPTGGVERRGLCDDDGPLLIRRLTPLECERLQGFPDGWTALPGAADSARYKALGNSVAIPCVEYIMRGIALAMNTAA